MSKSNSVYYNPKLNIVGIRSKRNCGDFLILDLKPCEVGGITDALEFSLIEAEWEYVGELDEHL